MVVIIRNMDDKYNIFFNQYNGQSNVGNNSVNKGECVGLASVFMDYFNIPHVYGNAKDIFYNAPDEYFTKILNTIDAIPQKGDIICWNGKMGGGYGHIGIDNGNAKQLTLDVFQQNDPTGSNCHVKTYSYDNIIGWLRVKNVGATPQPPQEIIVGNDVSEFQGDIDWNTYKNNTNFVIIRSTQGDGVMDNKFTQNREGARNAGIPLGFYHYAYPHLNTALAEADWCLLQLSDIRENESIYLDFEEDKIQDPVTWCKAFLDRIAEKRNGYKAIIYLNQMLCKKYDWTPVVNAGYKLWIAAYTYNPHLNTFEIGAWKTAAMQQWTSEQTVPGINGNVDGDVFFGNIDGFKALGYQKPVVVPPTDPCEAQNTTIASLNQQIKELNSKLVTLQGTVSNQEGLLLSNKTTIDSLIQQANKVVPLTEQVNELTDKVLKRDGEISTLKTQNGKLTDDIKKIQSLLVPKKYFSLALYKIAMALG